MRWLAAKSGHKERLDRLSLKVREDTVQFRISFNAHVKIINQVFDNPPTSDPFDEILRRPQMRWIGRQSATMLMRKCKLDSPNVNDVRHKVLPVRFSFSTTIGR